MTKKLKIILWVTIGLLAAAPPVTMVGYWQELGILTTDLPVTTTVQGTPLPIAILILASLLCASGILIVYWTHQTITQTKLKRYLLLAGASAMGMIFFGGPVHMFTEFGFVMATIVCPIALIVGAILALRNKATAQVTH
jgi:heme/copper-type cytochrome/quinol oxidase subunit 3